MRKIIHIDMDAFFASVEQLDNKELRGKPVIVGGVSERGVVSTCSYEARKYGIRSAMPTYMALKLCPDVVIRGVDFELYHKLSTQFFDYIRKYKQILKKQFGDSATDKNLYLSWKMVYD